MLKIIGTSNFADETISDILIADHVKEYYGKRIVEFLEKDCGENGTYYPKLVNDDYKLYDASTIY